jgi:tetratricopeptide (TPR) repeat protein
LASEGSEGSRWPATQRGERALWFGLIFAFALAIRAIMLWQLNGSDLFELRMGDGRVYDLWARRIAAGDWLGDEVFYQAPLYPYFLATLYRVGADGLLATRICQITLGAASCGILALAGWRFFSREVGIAAGLILAIYAPAFFADAMIQKSVLDTFLVSLVLLVLAGVGDSASSRRCLALGASVGILALSRENALVFVIALIPWLLWLGPAPASRRLLRAAALLTGFALVLGPVALRNWHVGGELHLTTSQFGHNFYIGNAAGADGTYRPLIYGRGDPLVERRDAIDLAERASGKKLTPAEVSNFYTERALEHIRAEPTTWLRLMLRKLALAFNAVELVDTEDQYTHAESSWLLRLSNAAFHFGILAPLALLGVFTSWSRRTRLLPLFLLFGAYAATLLLFYIFGRYRLPLVPILVMFAAAGVVGLRDFLRTSSREAIAGCGAAVAVFAIFCNWPLSDPDYMRSVTHYNIGNELVALDRVDDAALHYRQSIRLHSDNAMANHNLGTLYARSGDLVNASAHFAEALRIMPAYAQAHFNFARALRDRGESEAAIESYRRGLAIEPNRGDVLVELSELLDKLGRAQEAEETFRRARRVDPGIRAASQRE